MERGQAVSMARTILKNLLDRKGVGDELDMVRHDDPEIYAEIQEEIVDVLMEGG